MEVRTPYNSGIIWFMNVRLKIPTLLANATTYDKQFVTVEGFFIYFKDEVALYPISSRDRNFAEALKLVHPATVHGEAHTTNLNRKWVRVTGTFHNRSGARQGFFPGELSNIKSLEAIKSPRDH